MRLIALMTGIAILQGHLEVAETTCIEMALYTSKTNMLASDLERKFIVIEIFSEAIYTIMAIETGRPK